jgi:type I restriction enzyme, S subunit
MTKWPNKRIKELGRVVTGKTPPKNEPHYFDGAELFVSPKDLDWDQLYVTETETRVSSKALDKFRNQVLPKQSVMFTSLSFAFGKMGISSRVSLTNQQINSVIVNRENNFRFVYYLLKACTPFIFAYNSGIDTPIVPKSVFERIEVRCPELGLQKKIAAVLWAYDELIETNKQRIALLEGLAEEIYREWFVRLRFPGHEKVLVVKGVPQGWKCKGLSSLGTYLNGYAFEPSDWGLEGTPIIKIKEMTRGVTSDTPRNSGDAVPGKYRFDDGAVIFSWSATLLVVIWDQGPGLLNQHLFKVDPAPDVPKSFLYFSIKFSIPIFQSLTTGATMQHIKRKELDFVKVNLPPSDLRLHFDKLVSPLLEQRLTLTRANRSLIQMRDQLLPRLISGKLSVENLDIQFPPEMAEDLNTETRAPAHA